MNNATELKKLLEAAHFAAEKHKFQRRKGKLDIPYINHPLKVAKTLTECNEFNIDLLMAAILHDTVEDTKTTPEELLLNFGSEVSDLVMEVTDNMKLPAKYRKRQQIKHATQLTDNAKKIKLADKICNLNDIILLPNNWTHERKIKYFQWAQQVADGCAGVNSQLEKLFSDTFNNGIKALNNTKT